MFDVARFDEALLHLQRDRAHFAGTQASIERGDKDGGQFDFGKMSTRIFWYDTPPRISAIMHKAKTAYGFSARHGSAWGSHPLGAVMFQPKFPEMQGKGHEVIELSRLDDVPIGAPASRSNIAVV